MLNFAPSISRISGNIARLMSRHTIESPRLASFRQETWLEINFYGFTSSVYLKYIDGRLDGCKIYPLPDGGKLTRFKCGAMIIECSSGELIELDCKRRVLMVRVRRAQCRAEQNFGPVDESESPYQQIRRVNGDKVILLPSKIKIIETAGKVIIHTPSGLELSAVRSG